MKMEILLTGESTNSTLSRHHLHCTCTCSKTDAHLFEIQQNFKQNYFQMTITLNQQLKFRTILKYTDNITCHQKLIKSLTE